MRKQLIYLIVLSCSCGPGDRSNHSTIEVSTLFERIATIDSLFVARKDSVRAFAKLRNSNDVVEIHAFRSWPDNVEMAFNICYKDGRVILYKEMPIQEFDESSTSYSYYLSDSKVFAIDLEARYFNETCSESAIIENKIYARHGDEFALTKYTLVNSDGVSLDTIACGSTRLDNFPKYKYLSELPIAQFVE